MVSIKARTLSWFICCLLRLKVYCEEINGTFHYKFTWDETEEKLTHDMQVDLGDGSVDIVRSEFLDGDDWNINLPSRKSLVRVRRKAPEGDYVRHGPGCLMRQMDFLVDETPQQGRIRIGKAVHVALMATEHEEVQLTCHYCDPDEAAGTPETKEEQNKQKKSQLWYKLSRKLHKQKSEYFQLKEVTLDLFDDEKRNRVFVTEKHSLIIRRVSHKDGGTYICRDMTSEDKYMKQLLNTSDIAQMFEADDKLRFMYHLDVLKLSDPRKVKMVTTNKDFKSDIPLATPDVQVTDLNVHIFTVWEEWSPCSSCDQPGTRRRLGVCTVKKIDLSKPSVPWYLNMMLNIYTRGVLCRSTIFHTHDKLHKLVSRPGDEVEEVVCNVSCTNFSIKMTELLVSVPTTVKIEVFVLNEGEAVSLECPKAPKDMPVAWINGTRVLIRPWLKSQTDGRVSIDENNTFHISHLELTDAGHYLCVVGGGVLGRVMLGVEPIPPEVVVWRYAMYLMYSYPFDFAVFLLFLYVRHVQRKKVLNYDLLPDPDDVSTDSGSSASDINVNRNMNTSTTSSRSIDSNLLTVTTPVVLTATPTLITVTPSVKI